MKKIDYNNPNVDNPIILAPQLDKLSGVVNHDDQKLCGQTFHGMVAWIENNEPGVVKIPASGKYQLALKVHYPDSNGQIHSKSPAILLQITNPKCAKRQIRFEYNPYYMTEAGEEYLDVMFMEILGSSFYQFLHHARFTRVDFYRNILMRDIEDYFIKVKWAKFSQSFFGADGKLETINFGKAGSNQIIVYDKARQLYGPATQAKITRVEARCRINLDIHGLAKFRNPFERVQIYSVACKNPPFGLAHWLGFQDSCRMRGVSNAIKRQPVGYRNKLKKVLSQQPVSWWDINDDDWSWLLTNALEDAGLTNIPNQAPPLSYQYHMGLAA